MVRLCRFFKKNLCLVKICEHLLKFVKFFYFSIQDHSLKKLKFSVLKNKFCNRTALEI